MYAYQKQKDYLFTDEGQRLFLEIRDRTLNMLAQAGAVDMQHSAFGSHVSGDSWEMMACLDRMVELGEIRELPQPNCPGQWRVFVLTHG